MQIHHSRSSVVRVQGPYPPEPIRAPRNQDRRHSRRSCAKVNGCRPRLRCRPAGRPCRLAPRNRRSDPQAEGAEATGGAIELLGVKNWYQQQVDGPQPLWAVDKTNTAHRKKEMPVPSLLAHSWGPANASK